MLADSHRARMLYPELSNFGWNCLVLAPSPKFYDKVWADESDRGDLPPGVRYFEAQPSLAALYRWLKLGSAGLRAFIPMFFAGIHILRTQAIDLIYFTK